MKRMFIRKLLYFVSITVLIILTGCSSHKPIYEIQDAERKASLFISMEMRNIQYQKSDKLTIRFTFRNTTKNSVKLLKWNTPLEGFKSNFLNITHNGKKVAYIGKLVRRGEITKSDFITLNPNEVRTVILDLEKGYAIREPGKYKFYYNPKKILIADKILKKFDKNIFLSTDVTQLNHVEFYVKKSRIPCDAKKKLPPDGWGDSYPDEPYNCNDGVSGGGATTADYYNCTAAQKSSAAASLIRTRPLVAESYSAMLNGPSPSMRPLSPRYTTWFGHYSLPRWNEVKNTFSNMTSRLENRRTSFDCDCDDNSFAYVYADRPSLIWLCNIFWTTTNDERDVTIIHEASHWNVVGGTDDYAYTVAGSQALADEDPSKAVENAENYGYFGLNKPSLSMFWTDTRDHCSSTEDCTTGKVCRNNVCVNSNLCSNSSHCPGNMLCVSNRCVQREGECQRIVDCLNGQYCIDNSCVSTPFECRRDDQCGDSAFCINNLCMEY